MKQTIHHRSAQVEAVKPGTDLIPCVVSSDTPLRRGDYTEVLVHTPAAIDLSRAPLPVIIQHDTNNINVGVIESMTIVNGKLRGMLRMGKSAKAKEILQDILDGIVRSLSVGYVYQKYTDINDVVTATRWQPLEASLVSVPADPSAGLYRTHNLNLIKEHQAMEQNELEITTRSERKREGRELISHQAGAEAERARIRQLEELGRIHKVSDHLVRNWVDAGVSVDTATTATYELIIARGQNTRSIYADDGRGSFDDMYNTGGQDYGFGRNDLKDFSICRAVAATFNNDWRHAGLERSMSEAIAKKVNRDTAGFFVPVDVPMTRAPYAAGAAATGGNIVATNLLASSFIELLRNKTQVINLGATFLSGLVGNVDIPRRNASATTYWVGESSAIPESEGTLDKISLSPKTVGALCTYSRKLMLQSTPDIEALIRQEFVEIIALAIDKAALYGLGSSNQPLGVFNTSGIGSVVGGTNGGQVTLDSMLDLVAAVMNANAEGTSMGYLVNSKTQTSLSKLKSTTGQYLWARGGEFTSIAERMVDRINGYPLLTTNQLPSTNTKGTGTNLSSLIFGDWSSLVIGEWGALEIVPNPYGAGFAAGDVDIRVMQSVDIGVRHPESFAVMTDAITG